jgi:hypothetical protein
MRRRWENAHGARQGLRPESVAVFVAASASVAAVLVTAMLVWSIYLLYAYSVLCFALALTVLLSGGGLVAVLYRRVGDPSE